MNEHEHISHQAYNASRGERMNRLDNTEPIGYSDSGYSDTSATVTVFAIPKPFVNENLLLTVTNYCLQ